MAPPAASLMPTAYHDSAFPEISCRYKPYSPSLKGVTADATTSTAHGYTASVSTFEDLVCAIRAILGPSSGIDSADVDVESLMDTMRAYDSCGPDSHQWKRYALADPSRSYTRNGVDECNDKANLLILVWNPSKGSMIHDHANAHCVLKVLQGQLVETLYEWPEDSSSASTEEPHTMKVKKTSLLNTGDVAYMSDSLGLHRMSNPSSSELAVSLHLYTPPYAAKFGCLIFEETSGRRHHVKMSTLYSDKGELVKNSQSHNSC